MDRSEVINVLKTLKANCSKYFPEHQALDYAISSLKTDEAYQIMYEGGEIFTKDEVIGMFKDLQLEIKELPTNRMAITDSSGLICYGYSEYEPSAKDVSKLIQEKINKLKEQT